MQIVFFYLRTLTHGPPAAGEPLLGYESRKDDKDIASTDLSIIWGGGMIDGHKITVRPWTRSSKMYFHVLHNPKNLSELPSTYSVDMEEVRNETNGAASNRLKLQTITFMPPSKFPAEVLRLKERDLTVNRKQLEQSGAFVLPYRSRWFGSNTDVNYVE